MKINDIIDVNFNVVQEVVSAGTYEYALLLKNSASNVGTITVYKEMPLSLAGSTVADTENINGITKKEFRTFFENGGVYLAAGNVQSVADIITSINNLRTGKATWYGTTDAVTDAGCIYVVVPSDLATTDNIKAINNAFPVPNTVRVCTTITAAGQLDSDIGKYDVFIKFANAEDTNAALAFAAYMTNVDLDVTDTIKDYCYTQESVITPVDTVPEITEYDVNYVDTIGKYIVNVGGNLANGISADTDFGTICVENDVTNAVLTAVMSKIKINESGRTTLISAITDALQRFITNGFIKQNATYTGKNIVIKYGDTAKAYTILSTGETMQRGYKIYAIPTSDVSTADKAARKFPPIYVIIMCELGVRTIKIQGEVRS